YAYKRLSTHTITGSPRRVDPEIARRAIRRGRDARRPQNTTPLCSESPRTSRRASLVVVQDSTKSRAPSDRPILMPRGGTQREQRVAQALMISFEVIMRDVRLERPTQHPLPDRNQLR